MAGVTTAARMSLGAVASSFDQNPDKDWKLIAGTYFGGSTILTNLDQSYRNMRIIWHNSQQSTWISNNYMNFNNPSSATSNTPSATAGPSFYEYQGWSTGTSYGGSMTATSVVQQYGGNHSNYGSHLVMDIYNYASTTSLKPWHWQGYTGVGNATSYATANSGMGHFKEPAINDINVWQDYQNGSTSYNYIIVYGWGGKI
ncbi:MAG: hypothetical protein CMA96_02775 [Euryarchaeota archaeon]|nr:hypothetical protein [Euryarchaeota archaeon]